MKTLDELIEAGAKLFNDLEGESTFTKVKLIAKFVEENIKELSEEIKELDDSGKTKKEIAVCILNNAIDIPFIGEGLEEKFFGFLIDLAVKILKRSNWKI